MVVAVTTMCHTSSREPVMTFPLARVCAELDRRAVQAERLMNSSLELRMWEDAQFWREEMLVVVNERVHLRNALEQGWVRIDPGVDCDWMPWSSSAAIDGED